MENKTVVPLQKYCPGCESIQDAVFFGVDNARKDGLNPYCKECKKKRYKAFMENDEKKANKQVSNKAWQEANRDHINQRRRENRQKTLLEDPDYARRKKLWWNYKITPEKYKEILLSQDSSCAICREPSEGFKLLVDHDHSCCSTKAKSCGKCVRGLLCSYCNLNLGRIENKKWFQSASGYLLLFPTHER